MRCRIENWKCRVLAKWWGNWKERVWNYECCKRGLQRLVTAGVSLKTSWRTTQTMDCNILTPIFFDPKYYCGKIIISRWFGAGQSRTIELTVHTTNCKDLFCCLFSILNTIIILLSALFFQLFLHLQSLFKGITFDIHITGLSIPRHGEEVDVDFLRFWGDVSMGKPNNVLLSISHFLSTKILSTGWCLPATVRKTFLETLTGRTTGLSGFETSTRGHLSGFYVRATSGTWDLLEPPTSSRKNCVSFAVIFSYQISWLL